MVQRQAPADGTQESRRWFETIRRRRHLEPKQFAYAMMTRNKRLATTSCVHAGRGVRRASTAGSRSGRACRRAIRAPPPMFVPFRLRDLGSSKNRVVVSPMCMYSAEDGEVNDWHLVHLGARAVGGAGLVIAEMTDVSRDGRITPGCAGSTSRATSRRGGASSTSSTGGRDGQDRHADRARRPEGRDEAPVGGLRRAAGRRARGRSLSASARSRTTRYSQVPKPDGPRRHGPGEGRTSCARRDGRTRRASTCSRSTWRTATCWRASSRRSRTCATDEYGGPIENRMRYPLEVFAAVRAAWPEEKPMSVRLSAIDWKEGGQTIEDSIEVAQGAEGGWAAT